MEETGAPISLSQIRQIAIPVRDIARATSFYRDVLGMKFLFPAGQMAFFDCGGIRLMLSEPDDNRFQSFASIVYFAVDDIDVAYQALLEADVSFESAPQLVVDSEQIEIRMAFFKDLDENVLALTSEKPKVSDNESS